MSGRFEPETYADYTAGDTIFDIEKQTNGRIKVQDIMPLGCSDPMCDTGTFLVAAEDGGYVPATRDLTREEYLEYFDPTSPQGSVLPDILYKKGVDLNKGISLIIMDYMDAMTATMERMSEWMEEETRRGTVETFVEPAEAAAKHAEENK